MFLNQMKLPGLTDLILIFMLVSTSKGGSWNITVPSKFNVTLYSDLTINCTVFYPLQYQDDNVKIYWKKPVISPFPTGDNEKNAFIFHPNNLFVLEKYRGKTKLLTSNPEPTANAVKGNCSLKIYNITENHNGIYVRVIAKDEKEGKFSFIKYNVSISVHAPGVELVSPQPGTVGIPPQPAVTEETIPGASKDSPKSSYPAIFGSVAAVVLLIICVTGIVFGIKHKKSQSFTREESGYYANFSRSSSSQAKREVSSKKQENNKLPELKAIDEPIYINTEVGPVHMDQSMDHTDNIYANVNYSR